MKVSLDWLKDYVDYQGTAQDLAGIISQIGFEVDAIEPVGDDWMFDVDVTSNRPDCLGHIGLAREVATVTGAQFHLPEIKAPQGDKPASDYTRVTIEAPQLCGRYTARIIDGVTVGASPDWMVKRLEAVGVRSVSNVVDVTNYVMMEVGQPLHSFDYNNLAQGKIIVRQARPGEKMEMIDHSSIELKNDMLVIADAEKPAALAGVMGGLASEVTDATKTILLESAHFDPLCIRKTARALTMGSESSFRFERNVDIVTVDWAGRRAAALLAKVAGGQVAPGVADEWPAPWQGTVIRMRLSRLKALLGIDIPAEMVMRILETLSLTPKLEGNDVVCLQPSWRRDLTREVDLIEEVIRIYGYKHIPTEKKITINVSRPDAHQLTRQNVATTLIACGFHETVNVGFMDDAHVPLFAPDNFQPVRVRTDTRKSNNAARFTVLPSLLSVRQRNQAVGNGRCDCFELAAIHEPAGTDQVPRETLALGIMTDGNFQELRGVIEALLNQLNKNATLNCQPTDLLWTNPGQGATLTVNGNELGHAGRLSKKIQKAFDLENAPCLAQLNFSALVALQGQVVTLKPLPRFPGITRDLSLVLDETISWQKIQSVIEQQNIDDLRDIQFVDIYRGKGVDSGKKSLTLSMQFRRDEETLTHETVDPFEKQILNALETQLKATLRS